LAGRKNWVWDRQKTGSCLTWTRWLGVGCCHHHCRAHIQILGSVLWAWSKHDLALVGPAC
jgi:hypothetical protein